MSSPGLNSNNRFESIINKDLIKIGSDGRSAETKISWEGRSLTLKQTYSSSKSLNEAEASMRNSLEKMLLLADVYRLGAEGSKTESLKLQGNRLTRLGTGGEKTYDDIGTHLEEKGKKYLSPKEGLEEEARLKKQAVILNAVTVFKGAVSLPSPSPESEITSPLKGKVKKELNKKQTSFATKLGRVALAVIFGVVALAVSPLALLVAGGAAAGKTLADFIRVKKDHEGDHLLTANKKMKNEEERIKLEAAQRYAGELDNIEKLTEGLENKLLDKATHQGQIERLILRKLGSLEKRDEVRKVVAELDLEKDYPEGSIAQIAKETVNEMRKTNRFMSGDSKRASTESAKFRKLLGKFREPLSTKSSDTRKANEKITRRLRRLIQSEAYQALKHDPSDPAIQFIHRFAAGIWTEVKVLDTYQEFGQKAIERANVLYPSGEKSERSVSKAISGSLQSVAYDLFQVRRLPELLLYTFTHPLQTLASIISEGHWYSNPLATIVGEYDPHGRLSNNPSLQGTTEVVYKGQTAIVNNVYGGSPTIKDYVSPEFLAVLQAAENNQFAQKKDPSIPDRVFYTNFQDLKKEGENRRSVAIMQLNQQYPLSFVGITLSKDSDFYLMPSHKKDSSSIKWESAEKMSEEMLRHLTDLSSFTLENRGKSTAGPQDKGFYFPGAKENWEPIFKAVLESANEMFKHKPAVGGEEAYKLRGAYQEYVYASLQLYLEVKLIQDARQSGISEPHIHSQRACKENIDRGGAANAAYLNLRMGKSVKAYDQKVIEELVVGTLHCRALGARDRMILPDRLPQVLAFIDLVNPPEFWKLQENLLQKEFKDKVSLSFTPALNL